MGRAVTTWETFPASGEVGDWWCASDMLFVGYDSVRDDVTAVARRLRLRLPELAPNVPPDLLTIDGASVRDVGPPYEELYLVGHSLGGLVIRYALADAAQDWLDRREAGDDNARSVLLDARVRLFSPASAGFSAAGTLGIIRATPIWTAINMYVRRSSAYTDLQPESSLLADTRRRTERLVAAHRDELGALRPAILWANPDDVVLTQRYDSDPVDDHIDNRTHQSVCKPTSEFTAPWRFVETGRLR